ncbi:MAG: hypothetical protein P4K93_10650 [Terracidiphilus sp.]|nr:hypothetical protein [Terracidiphilus sp.]MDR3798605.1 hypothetical protein [Terracidiphilus sp.]
MPSLVGRLFIIRLLFTSIVVQSSLAQTAAPTKVILDHETFSQVAIKEFEPVAAQVSSLIDSLIPGFAKGYPPAGIICFEAPPNLGEGWGANPPPITLTGPKLPGEPSETVAGTIRIALFKVQPRDKFRFAFQLSHELAHVKMGPRSDNFLDETFAVAVSYEVLRRLGYEGYLLINQGLYVQDLPLQIQKSVSYGKWKDAQIYWLDQAQKQGESMGDRPFQTLGAFLLLRGRGPRWNDLLNISYLNSCPNRVADDQFHICPPDLPRMRVASRELRALGFKPDQLKERK